MEILGLIPARGGSKGVPGKNIKSLGGRPLIDYTFEAAAASRLLSRVILTTDSAEIADHGRRHGVETPFLRPAELANDVAPASAYIRHCLQFLYEKEGYRPDVVALLQPTCPFRLASDIDTVLQLLEDENVDSAVSVTELPQHFHPHWQFTVTPEGALRPATAQVTWGGLVTGRQQLSSTYTRNGAIYAFRTSVFKRYGHIYGEQVRAYVMPKERSVNIDGWDDWRLAEDYLAGKPAGCAS